MPLDIHDTKPILYFICVYPLRVRASVPFGRAEARLFMKDKSTLRPSLYQIRQQKAELQLADSPHEPGEGNEVWGARFIPPSKIPEIAIAWPERLITSSFAKWGMGLPRRGI